MINRMKASYGLPEALFDQRIHDSDETMNKTFEETIRAAAHAGYQHAAMPDKELQRFIVPSVPQSNSAEQGAVTSFYRALGEHSFIASPDKAPFIPPECTELLAAYKEPRSLLHVLGVTCTSMRIIYIAEDLTEVSLQQLAAIPSRELIMLVVKPGVTVSFTDEFSAEQLYARSILAIIQSQAQVTLVGDHSYGAYGLQHDRWHLESGAQLTCGEVHTGGKQSWLRKEFMLADEAQVNYTWLSALRADEQAALTTVQTHQGASSKSSVLIKTALSEQARSFYRGMIRIEPEASQAKADQQQKALMLSRLARTCAIPGLEVKTHDVQCWHGSAAGRFNKEELWYLMARGLSKEQAQRVLLEGFFNEEFLAGTQLGTKLKNRVVFGEGG